MGFRKLVNATGTNPDCEMSPQRVTIHTLPNEILLMTFDFCRVAVMKAPYWWSGPWTETWQNLVHVCQRWRYVVFSSPLGLDLRLSCTDRSPSVREMLDVWPPLPIEIESSELGDDIIAALEHHDRITHLSLCPYSRSRFERLDPVMRNPFPALRQLRFIDRSEFSHVLVLPNTYLGGSAPNLRSLYLEGVVFPTLPQFLWSCNDLSELCLDNIIDSRYISPEAMATGLSALTRLTSLSIMFFWVILSPAMPPPLTRVLLPALTELHFRGLAEYLEDLLARIDAPQIKILFINLFQQSVIDIRQVISRSPSLGPFDCAMLKFGPSAVLIHLDQSEGAASSIMELGTDHHAPGRQLSSLVQICTQSSTLLSSVTELNIIDEGSFSASVDEEDLMSNPQWLVLLNPFTAVRMLRLSGEIQSSIVSLLGGLTRERAIAVLPEVENLLLHESDWRDELEVPLKEFVAARQHSDHPVRWDLITSAS